MSLKNNNPSLRQKQQSDDTVSPFPNKRPRLLRLRLITWYGGLVAVSLLFFGVLVFLLTSQSLSNSVDASLRAEAGAAQANIRAELLRHQRLHADSDWPTPLSLSVIDTHSLSKDTLGITVKVFDQAHHLQYASKNEPLNITPTAEMYQHALQNADNPQPYTVSGPNKESLRILVEPIHKPQVAPGGQPGPVIGMLLVARSLSPEEATKTQLLFLLCTTGALVLITALGIGWGITTNVLHPLSDMVKTARDIANEARGVHVGNLHQRVQRPKGHDEMVEVVDTFNEMLAALEKATTAQHRFIADASHELRAPLTTIQGNLAFLQRHSDELPAEERKTMLLDAHSETLRLARLVDELLLLARADVSADTIVPPPPIEQEQKPAVAAPRGNLREQPVELDHSLLQLVRQLRGRLAMDQSSFQLKVSHIEPVRVYGNEENLRRIMLILLDNALKYAPAKENGHGGIITVSLERKGQEALLQVRDNGIGIEPGDLPHIFERFYRADRARSREGTGLGLAIAHTLVEQLNGRITAESQPGEGSTFYVWLPLAV
ncbi:two-component sensor histidine kinase [Ktedonobacter sp. SOSP1-85]|uniref:sensor histidine kinase n=1 Tax=Ktedonobacter sp. SOSP1-85 TaxID=2778367 RepID=UPI0019159ED2|nr:HAMP domain-containing sensor histidine kinase [Ktedonobacter sp. SOSP1-85]GHO77592.1 two-component sensor histidine kinase [Ktedonobacter sp. SOSP1-85]